MTQINAFYLVCFAIYKLTFLPTYPQAHRRLPFFLENPLPCPRLLPPVPTLTKGLPTGLSLEGSRQLCPAATMSQVVLSKGAGDNQRSK